MTEMTLPATLAHDPMRLHCGVAIANDEAAAVLVEHRLLAPLTPGGPARRVWDSLVRAIVRPPANVDAMADALASLAEDLAIEEPHFRVYPDGLGTALHLTLTHERQLATSSSYGALMRRGGRTPFLSRRAVSLFTRRGRDQQGLLDRLGDARRLGLLRFEDGLRHQAAMDEALATYDREARDDRSIPPLVAALALAVHQPAYGGQPRAVGRDGRLYPSRDAAVAAGSGAW